MLGNHRTVRKTRQPVRVTRLGEILVDIVPLSPAKNDSGAKRLRKKLPRTAKAHPGR